MTKQDSVIISAPPLPDSQGYIAGVRMGDKVLFINHVDMRGKTSADAMRAVEDTGDREVELVVSEKEEKGPEMVKSFRLRKKKSSKSSLSYELIAASNQKKVGYIRLKEFDGRSGGDMADALKHLSSSDLLLLDLRGNPGGLLQEAIEISGYLLENVEGEPSKKVAWVQTRAGDLETILVPNGKTIDAETPLIVVVDRRTASASEVLTGSLQDYCRAYVIGSNKRSFGKGLIQGAFPLSDGSGLMLTIAKYFTPDFHDIQSQGIRPDETANLMSLRASLASGGLIPDSDALKDNMAECRASKTTAKMQQGPRRGGGY
mmetsp:Transcript_28726/g.92678  ORF Transcript_28726/g.92678 Transcript_28726/m.92678 type:complete len:317 (+) Transcript_28726:43-993(+)